MAAGAAAISCNTSARPNADIASLPVRHFFATSA
jgi:hypothetical protein